MAPHGTDDTFKFERRAGTFTAIFIVGALVYLVIRNEGFKDANLVVIFRIVLAVAMGILGASIMGFLSVAYDGGGISLRAAGALALFVITFFGTPKVEPLGLAVTPAPLANPNNLPPPPARKTFSEELALSERDVGVSHGVTLKTQFIGISGQAWVEVAASTGGGSANGGRLNKGASITLYRSDCDFLNVLVKNIEFKIDGPYTPDDLRKMGPAAEALLHRKATFIVEGRCEE